MLHRWSDYLTSATYTVQSCKYLTLSQNCQSLSKQIKFLPPTKKLSFRLTVIPSLAWKKWIQENKKKKDNFQSFISWVGLVEIEWVPSMSHVQSKCFMLKAVKVGESKKDNQLRWGIENKEMKDLRESMPPSPWKMPALLAVMKPENSGKGL